MSLASYFVLWVTGSAAAVSRIRAHPRGTEGDGASALGGREGRGGPGPPREQPEHTRESRDRFRPLGFPRLRAPRRSRAPPH